MFQLGRTENNKVVWDKSLVFDDFTNASTAAKNLFQISGKIYVIKQVGGFGNV